MNRFLADTVFLVHLAYILFVIFGALLALVWRRVPWIHVPALLWAVFLELTGRICPLTPLENRLRQAAGEAGYSGGFIEHYLVPLVYPAHLTRSLQIALGVGLVVLNVALYLVVRRRRGRIQRALARAPRRPS